MKKQVIYIFIHPATAVITTLTVDIPPNEWCKCDDCQSDAKLLEITEPSLVQGPNRKLINAMIEEGQSLCNWHIVTGGESCGECNGRLNVFDTRNGAISVGAK